MQMRIGFGFDSHPFEKGKKLVLGGVEIEGEWGLKGVSDADVVIHALCDALLGAIGEEDLGQLFPDTDEANLGRDSTEFLEYVMRLVRDKGYRVNNVDITIILEKPYLSPYKEVMRKKLSALLDIGEEEIGLKAKRPEGLGVKECCICMAFVVLTKD